jgi:hypothetical protein
MDVRLRVVEFGGVRYRCVTEPQWAIRRQGSNRPALALAGPACRALESGHAGNAPAWTVGGSGEGAGTRLCTAQDPSAVATSIPLEL